MSKTAQELSTEILVAVIAASAASKDIDATSVSEAYGIIFKAVSESFARKPLKIDSRALA